MGKNVVFKTTQEFCIVNTSQRATSSNKQATDAMSFHHLNPVLSNKIFKRPRFYYRSGLSIKLILVSFIINVAILIPDKIFQTCVGNINS